MSLELVWPDYKSLEEELEELCVFWKFSYEPSSKYAGTCMFEMQTDSGETFVRTIRVHPSEGVQVWESPPPDDSLSVHVTVPFKTVSDVFWGRISCRELVMNGGCKVHGWAFRELLNFGLSFDSSTANWANYYKWKDANGIVIGKAEMGECVSDGVDEVMGHFVDIPDTDLVEWVHTATGAMPSFQKSIDHSSTRRRTRKNGMFRLQSSDKSQSEERIGALPQAATSKTVLLRNNGFKFDRYNGRYYRSPISLSLTRAKISSAIDTVGHSYGQRLSAALEAINLPVPTERSPFVFRRSQKPMTSFKSLRAAGRRRVDQFLSNVHELRTSDFASQLYYSWL